MKKSICITAIVLALILALAPLSVAAASGDGAVDYVIDNPYRNINWDTWKAYKAQLHCHTNASDGYLTVKEVVQKSYDLDYDILAITDHGTINKGWNNEPDLIPIMRLVKRERTKMADIIPLTSEEYSSFINGTAAKTNGSSRANGMIDVPKGIELNFATPITDCHLTGYFSDYGQGLVGVYGDYETPAAGVNAAGGITMLSHVGEYVYPEKDSANYVGKKIDEYYVNKFARVFLDNKGSCVGMGINSSTDEHTRCDRILYDQILMKTIPNGVTPWGFTFSDSHNTDSLNHAYTYHYLPELSKEAFRASMENGELFAVSHYSNGLELNGMAEMPERTEGEYDDHYVVTPMVSRVTVDDENDTITVVGTNFDTITWVADGEVICRGGEEAMTLNLSEYEDIDCFVRFYLSGKDGICYSQPFAVREAGTQYEKVDVPATRDLPAALRLLVTVLDNLIFKNSLFIRLFKLIAIGY